MASESGFFALLFPRFVYIRVKSLFLVSPRVHSWLCSEEMMVEEGEEEEEEKEEAEKQRRESFVAR